MFGQDFNKRSTTKSLNDYAGADLTLHTTSHRLRIHKDDACTTIPLSCMVFNKSLNKDKNQFSSVVAINYMRYYILICRIYCHVYSFFGRLTSKVIIYINGKNIELFTFISLYCRNNCLCYFYNTSFLGTFKI